MKTILLALCSLVLFIIAHCEAASLRRHKRQLVPKEFANINIENYLKNDRAVQFQLKCIVYDGPCDRIGKYLKVTIPELLTNQCQNCDPAQRQRAGRLVQHIQQKFPKEWSDAVQKFQGGQVKKEDADKLETLLGVKLDSKLVADATTTIAPITTTTTTTAAPAVSSSTEASTTSAPSSTTSTTAQSTTSAAPEVTSATPVSSSSAVPEVTSSSAIPSSEAPIILSSSPATISSSSASPVQVSSSSTAPEVSTSAAPSSTTTTAAPTSAATSPTPTPVISTEASSSSSTTTTVPVV